MSAFLHPFAPPSKAEADFTRIVGAEGSTLTADDGSTYLDAIGGLWYCQVGYGRREIIDAIKAQLDRLVVHHTFDPFTNGPARSEEHTSELQSRVSISYAVFCLKKLSVLLWGLGSM